MDRYAAMQAYVQVVDARGFAPAARRLGLSPAAVTRLVAALEAQLGVRLLARTTRAVTPTDAGLRYLERARHLLAAFTEAEEAAQTERSQARGHLVIGAPLMFGRLHVAPLLARYLAREPQLSAELLLGDRYASLIEERIDVAVRIGALADSTLVTRQVGAVRRVLVAAPDYLARRGVPQTPAGLSGHELIACTAVTPGQEWTFGDGERLQRVAVAPRLRSNSADAAILYAERGGGITAVLAYQVADALRAARLAIVLAAYEPPPLPIRLVYPSAQGLPARTRRFIDLVVADSNWRFTDFDVPPDTAATVPGTASDRLVPGQDAGA